MVFVSDSPKLQANTSEVHIGIDGTVTLDCQVDSEPASKVTWYHDSLLLQPTFGADMRRDGNHHLLFLDGHVNDVVGEYRCQADNRLGRGSQVIQVTGQPVVSFGQVHHLGWGRFRISWDTVSQLPITSVWIKYRRMKKELSEDPTGQWETEELPVDTDQSWYEMNHLWSDSVYEVSVSCLNDLGWSKEVTKQFYTDTQTPEELQSLALVSSSSTQSSSMFSILSTTVLLTLLSKLFQ